MGAKKVFLNGALVSEGEARVSVLDRGFTYGDGLFETMRVTRGKAFFWDRHIDRLQRGLQFLQIQLRFSDEDLARGAERLIDENDAADAVLRLLVSRGVGARGYSPRGAENPTVVMTLHDPPPPPKPFRLLTSSYRLRSGDPFLQHKTCNKLQHVMARAEAEQQGFDEALLLNERGEVVTAASANLFFVAGDAVRTAPVAAGALPGVTRAILQDICGACDIDYAEGVAGRETLTRSDAIFLTSSALGIVPVGAVDGEDFETGKTIPRLISAYGQLQD